MSVESRPVISISRILILISVILFVLVFFGVTFGPAGAVGTLGLAGAFLATGLGLA